MGRLDSIAGGFVVAPLLSEQHFDSGESEYSIIWVSNLQLCQTGRVKCADLSSNIRIFDQLVTNIWLKNRVCRVQIGISGYSSNPNPGSRGSNIRFAVHCRCCGLGRQTSLFVATLEKQIHNFVGKWFWQGHIYVGTYLHVRENSASFYLDYFAVLEFHKSEFS